MDILLDAHGVWDPGSVPPYTITPKGSTVYYFVDNMRLFLDSDIARLKLETAKPTDTIGPQKSIQNYSVSPAPEVDYMVPAGMTRKVPPGDMLLCTSTQCVDNGWHNPDVCKGLFSDLDYENSNIYFAVCRGIKWKRKTGKIPEIGSGQRPQGELSPEACDQWIAETFDDPEDWQYMSRAERDKVLAEDLDGEPAERQTDIRRLYARMDERWPV